MFTLDQIKSAHSKVKSGADFPAFIAELKSLGVAAYTTWVATGNTDYANSAGAKLSTGDKYTPLHIAIATNKEQFLSDLRAHQSGNTDYQQFCLDCAQAGIEKWIVALDAMTCSYFDQSGKQVFMERIPE